MEYGMMLEVYVIVILIVKIFLFYYFDLIYVEEGVYVIRWNEVFFIFVLFDGSLGKINLDGIGILFLFIGCEFKCFLFFEYKIFVYYEILVRYVFLYVCY